MLSSDRALRYDRESAFNLGEVIWSLLLAWMFKLYRIHRTNAYFFLNFSNVE